MPSKLCYAARGLYAFQIVLCGPRAVCLPNCVMRPAGCMPSKLCLCGPRAVGLPNCVNAARGLYAFQILFMRPAGCMPSKLCYAARGLYAFQIVLCGPRAVCLPNCVMRPAVTFANEANLAQIAQQYSRLCIPLCIIFILTAGEPDRINCCGPLSGNVCTPIN